MTFTVTRDQMSPEAFALLGAGRLAYVRAVRSEDVAVLHAEAPSLAPGEIVFVLHDADGSPLVIAETLEAAIADAVRHQRDTVSVH